VVRREDDDGYGQVDGDYAAHASFVHYNPVSAGQPWLRAGMPPWHMWGGTQTFVLPFGTDFQSQQLARCSYKRPESWHWLFQAKLIAAPGVPSSDASVLIFFDLIVGLGRTQVVLPAFETYLFRWTTVTAPIGELKYSNRVFGPARLDSVTPDARDNTIDEIVAQDIQVSARALFGGNVALGSTATMEVSAFFSPKTHVRPDWMLAGPPEVRFAGGEDGGR
jgi:hypothetical protein